jgi:hypothetical protein
MILFLLNYSGTSHLDAWSKEIILVADYRHAGKILSLRFIVLTKVFQI